MIHQDYIDGFRASHTPLSPGPFGAWSGDLQDFRVRQLSAEEALSTFSAGIFSLEGMIEELHRHVEDMKMSRMALRKYMEEKGYL